MASDLATGVRGDAFGPAEEAKGDSWREEALQLRKAIERRPVIDMARGVLMAVWSCSQDEAWKILVQVSQHSNTKLFEVATAVTATVRQQTMPDDLRKHLSAAVRDSRSRQRRTPPGADSVASRAESALDGGGHKGRRPVASHEEVVAERARSKELVWKAQQLRQRCRCLADTHHALKRQCRHMAALDPTPTSMGPSRSGTSG
ncbi:ANTAR domain-containing protein [Actinomycetota bacterium Odt1-20B]